MFESRGVAAIWSREQKKSQTLGEENRKPPNGEGSAECGVCASQLESPRPRFLEESWGVHGIWSREGAGQAWRKQAQVRRDTCSDVVQGSEPSWVVRRAPGGRGLTRAARDPHRQRDACVDGGACSSQLRPAASVP